MIWNIDFEIASICFQLIFLCLFVLKRHLPTRQNRLYFACIAISFVTVSLDVISAIMSSYPQRFGIELLNVINTLYLAVVPFLSLFFFIYILAITDQFGFVRNPLFVVFALPAILSFLMAVSSPFTGFLFYFDENMMYHQGSYYMLEFASNAFYIVMAMAFVTAFKKQVSRLERMSIYFFCLALVVGVILQGLFFRQVLLTNAMTAMAMIVIYLSLQNPDSYIDRNTGMFNLDAFNLITNENLSEGKAFSCIFFNIDGYQELDALYGAENVIAATKELTSYLYKVYTPKKVFRVDASSFILVESEDGDYEVLVRALINRFEKPFKGVELSIRFVPDIVVIPYGHMPSDLTGINALVSFIRRSVSKVEKGYVVWTDEKIINSMAHERAVERAVEQAVANNSIQVYFQPIYSTEKKRVISCEALARLFDDEIGFVSPEEFIKKAEENGSIVKLGVQIFEKVCSFISRHDMESMGLDDIHVNLSPIQCKQEKLVAELSNITKKYGVKNEHIVLEITETAAVEENRDIRNNMNALITEGFTFALDDYGTGFSNTAAIIQLPFSCVKMDKSLLWSHFSKRSSILPDLVNMFHNQRLELVIEGVETKEMVETLTELKCQRLQGFFFSRPLPEREFISYVRDFNRKQ